MNLGKIKILIERYLKGKGSKNDDQLVNNWLDKLAEKSKLDVNPDVQQKRKIHDRIFGSMEERIRARNSTRSMHNWMKAAAIFILFLMCAIYFINPANHINELTYITTVGEEKEIILPDKSFVLLKANSVLKFPERFEYTRDMELTGEAFFEVQKDPNKKFKVHTNHLLVEVQAASFDVKAYEKLADLSVQVRTGKVLVRNQDETLGLLLPNDKLVYNKFTGQSSIVKSELVLDARDSKTLAFENASLNEIFITLENYYPVVFEVHVKKKVKLSGSFNSTMPIDHIVEVLNSIAGRHNIRIVKQSDTQYIVE